MINGIQIMLARNLIGISQLQLAQATKISLSTIRRIEEARYDVYTKGSIANLLNISAFFKTKGFEFIDEKDKVGLVINKKIGKKLEKERITRDKQKSKK